MLPIEDAIFVERIGEAHQHAALNLAFEQQRIDRPSAVLHRDDPLDPDDPGLGIDRDLGELHAADILLRLRRFAHRPAETPIILASGFGHRKHVPFDQRRRIGEAHAALRLALRFDPSAARDEVARRGV